MCPAPSLEHGLLPDIVELCAGSGGMGVGAAFTGGRVAVSVDINGLSTQHLTANLHGEALQLDVTDHASIKIIHQAFLELDRNCHIGCSMSAIFQAGLQIGCC